MWDLVAGGGVWVDVNMVVGWFRIKLSNNTRLPYSVLLQMAFPRDGSLALQPASHILFTTIRQAVQRRNKLHVCNNQNCQIYLPSNTSLFAFLRAYGYTAFSPTNFTFLESIIDFL